MPDGAAYAADCRAGPGRRRPARIRAQRTPQAVTTAIVAGFHVGAEYIQPQHVERKLITILSAYLLGLLIGGEVDGAAGAPIWQIVDAVFQSLI